MGIKIFELTEIILEDKYVKTYIVMYCNRERLVRDHYKSITLN